MPIIINNIEYVERTPNKKLSGYLPFMAIALVTGGIRHAQTNSYYDHNIVSEFELIQAKKSKLSRSEREQVIRRFNRIYKIKDI